MKDEIETRPLTDAGAKRVLAELRRREIWNLQEFLDWVEQNTPVHERLTPWEEAYREMAALFPNSPHLPSR